MQGKSSTFVNFPEKLRDLRWRLRLTRKKMGVKLGVTGTYVYLLESGRKPATQNIIDKIEEIEAANPIPIENPPGKVQAPSQDADVDELSKRLTEIKRLDQDVFESVERVIQTLHQRINTKETLPGVSKVVADKARGLAPTALRKALREARERRQKQKAVSPTGNKSELTAGADRNSKSPPESPTPAPKSHAS